jgi:transglutaminase-like putative cysteine protease
MLLEIIHHTRYHYSVPVFLEPFTIRLRPRSDANQTLRSYAVDIAPRPDGIAHCAELDGNNTETVWFSGLHENLLIDVRTRVETHYGDPFNFLITDDGAATLPVKYQPQLNVALAPYLLRDGNGSQVAALAREMMDAAKHETIPFLSQLSNEIYQRLTYMLREHGDPWAPEETLKQGQGSCRDFTMLFIDVCRSAGIAARFVSGYCVGDESAEGDMHAWAEVYLPGAGWRGFDPSRGLSISDDYIAVAAGRRPQDAAPTFGSFRGDAATTFDAGIVINALQDDVATI